MICGSTVKIIWKNKRMPRIHSAKPEHHDANVKAMGLIPRRTELFKSSVIDLASFESRALHCRLHSVRGHSRGIRGERTGLGDNAHQQIEHDRRVQRQGCPLSAL